MKKILGAVIAATVLTIPTAANAGTPSPVPFEWGGGSAVVEIPDFTYPASNGCFYNTGTATLPGNNPAYWDYLVLDLTVTDSVGRVTDFFYDYEAGYVTSFELKSFLCTTFDAAGTYNVTGTFEFNDGIYSYTAPVSDQFTIKSYVAPAPPPPQVTQQPAAPSNKCVKAKAALKKAKKADKPPAVIKRLKTKVKKVC